VSVSTVRRAHRDSSEGGASAPFSVHLRQDADKAQQVFDRAIARTDSTVANHQEMPVFPGGDAGLRKFLKEQSVYPPEAKAQGIIGKVFVRFLVETDGRVDSVSILRGAHPLLDAEALRVVRLADGWEPGRMNGKPVRVTYTLPISFDMDPKVAERLRRKAAKRAAKEAARRSSTK
jgi:TonB family protein